MQVILKRLPIIRAIIAKREQAQLEREAAESFARFMADWEKLSEAQAIRACGFSSAAEARATLRFMLG